MKRSLAGRLGLLAGGLLAFGAVSAAPLGAAEERALVAGGELEGDVELPGHQPEGAGGAVHVEDLGLFS